MFQTEDVKTKHVDLLGPKRKANPPTRPLCDNDASPPLRFQRRSVFRGRCEGDEGDVGALGRRRGDRCMGFGCIGGWGGFA